MSKNKLAFPIIIILAIVLRIILIKSKGFSSWEAESAIYAKRYFFITYLLSIKGNHPPLYYLALHFWAFLGNSEIYLRVFSLLCGTGIILLIYILTKELFSREVALICTFFAAISPSLIFLSQDVTPFNFGILMIILSLLFWYKYFSYGNLKLRNWVIVSSLLSLYSLHTAILIFIGQIFWVYILHRSQKLEIGSQKSKIVEQNSGVENQNNCSSNVCSDINWEERWELCKELVKTIIYYFIPGIVTICLQIPHNILKIDYLHSFSKEGLYLFPLYLGDITFSTLLNHKINLIILVFLFIIVLLILISSVFKLKFSRGKESKDIAYYTETNKMLYLFIPFSFMFLVLCIFNLIIGGTLRTIHLLPLIPFILLLISKWISALNKKYFKGISIMIIIFIMAFGLCRYYKKDYKDNRWREALKYLGKNLKVEDGLAYVGFPTEWIIRHYINVPGYDYIAFPSIKPIILGLDPESPFYESEKIYPEIKTLQELFSRHEYVWIVKNSSSRLEKLPDNTTLKSVLDWMRVFSFPIEQREFKENILVAKYKLIKEFSGTQFKTLLTMNKVKEAEEIILKVEKNNPEEAIKLLFLLFEFYMKKDMAIEAENTLNKIETYEQKNNLLNKGIELYIEEEGNDKPDKLINLMKEMQCISIATITRYFGSYYHSHSQKEKEKEIYNTLLDMCISIGNLDNVLESINQLKIADEQIRKELLVRLYKSLSVNKDLSTMVKILEELTQIENKNADVFFNLAILYIRQKNYESAKNMLLNALKIKPDDEEIKKALQYIEQVK